MKIKQDSEKNSWMGVDIQCIGKPGTKGAFHMPYLSALMKKCEKYLQSCNAEDFRPPLVSFYPVTEEQLCKDSGFCIYTKGCLHLQKELLYRIFKTETRLVRSILETAGFSSTDSHEWNLLWVGSSAQVYLYENLNKFQKISHFPCSFELTRKDRMHVNLSSMIATHGKNDFDFVPETYLLPEQYESFFAASVKSKELWIHKPCSSSQGRGIFLLGSPSEIPADEACVVSRYISNPLLINDLKFDIRVYVLVSSFDPLRIYVYDEGLARFASDNYNVNNKNNKFSHLTNYSINKKSEKFVQNQDWRQDNLGHKWSLAALNKSLESIGVDTSLLWLKIYDLIIKSIISIEGIVVEKLRNLVVHRNNCFDLFGFDILVDSDLKPWLLEVNLSPSLATDSPLDLHIKSALIADTFNLIGVRAFDRKKEILNKVSARMKVRQIQLARKRREFGETLSGCFDTKQEKYWEIFRDSLEEHERKGQFLRIYPAKGCDHYDRFFIGLRPNNKALFRFLFSDLWEEETNWPVKTVKKSSTTKLTEDSAAIHFEDLLSEYLCRLAHALKTLPDDSIKPEWNATIESFLTSTYWGNSASLHLPIWQQIEEKSKELKKKSQEDKKAVILKGLTAAKLEESIKISGKGKHSEILNHMFSDDKPGVLSSIIQWLSLRTHKKSSLVRRKSREYESSVDQSWSYSPAPASIRHRFFNTRRENFSFAEKKPSKAQSNIQYQYKS